jgi:DNA-binding transcriptional LysR family regulator
LRDTEDHQSDSLDVVEDLIVAGMGVALLPADRPPRPRVARLALTQPEVRLRAYAHTRRGRTAWPPLRLVLDRLTG